MTKKKLLISTLLISTNLLAATPSQLNTKRPAKKTVVQKVTTPASATQKAVAETPSTSSFSLEELVSDIKKINGKNTIQAGLARDSFAKTSVTDQNVTMTGFQLAADFEMKYAALSKLDPRLTSSFKPFFSYQTGEKNNEVVELGEDDLVTSAWADSKFKSIAFGISKSLNFTWQLPNGDTLKPYVQAGLGYQILQMKTDLGYTFTSPSPESESQTITFQQKITGNGFFTTIGAGTGWQIKNSNFVPFAALNYKVLNASGADAKYDKQKVKQTQILLGLGYLL